MEASLVVKRGLRLYFPRGPPAPADAQPHQSLIPCFRMVRLPEVTIHADESCLGNQFQDRANPGGAAGLVEFWKGTHWERRDYWVSEGGTTNNRMAIRSAIVGLGLLKRPCRVRFVSDSQYLVKGITEWVGGWKARGLWKQLDRAVERHQIEWTWVRGHAGHPRNEYANHLAVRAAKQQDQSGGLVSSGFPAWLEVQREKREKFLDFFEDLPPGVGP